MKLRLLPIVLPCLWGLGAVVPCRAQHAHPVPELPVLVDGAKAPGKIPDELAYAHFLAAVAVEDSAPEEARRRQAAQLLPLGLAPEQQAVLTRILAGLKAHMDETERGIHEANSGLQGVQASQRIAALLEQRKQMMPAAVAEIRRSLPPEAVDRIEQHVRTRVKPRIVIYGTRP